MSGATAWDSARLQTILNRRVLEQRSQVEKSQHDAVAFIFCGVLFYGHSVEDLDMRLNGADQFRKMLEEPNSFGLKMIKDMMISLPFVVQGLPSKRLQADMREQEESRVQKLKDQLGEAGLTKKQAELAGAIEMKEASAPDSFSSSPCPSPAPTPYSSLPG